MTRLLFLAHVGSTLAMCGAIWVVQLVHYPLFAGVGAGGWAAYQAQHQARITWVVAPLMVLELATAVALVVLRPPEVPLGALLAGAALVGIIWASTAFVQVPLHQALGPSFDAEAHARLVATNWIRTLAWTARAALVLWMADRWLRAAALS